MCVGPSACEGVVGVPPLLVLSLLLLLLNSVQGGTVRFVVWIEAGRRGRVIVERLVGVTTEIVPTVRHRGRITVTAMYVVSSAGEMETREGRSARDLDG